MDARPLIDTVSESSRLAYINSSTRFIDWIWLNNRSLLSESFAENYESVPSRQRSAYVKNYLSQSRSNSCPLKLESLTGQDFMIWLVSLKKSDNSRPGNASFNTHRAALFNLFRDYKVTIPTQLTEELRVSLNDLKRTISERQLAGNDTVKVGKDPFPIEIYRFMSKHMLLSPDKEYIFARCFSVLCWNLIARASNVFAISDSHMEWVDDSLCIYSSHTKNDQLGERLRNPRHIYANPVIPEICPILALGLYLLDFGMGSQDRKLFPGKIQYERFRKCLGEFLDSQVMKDQLIHRGSESDDYGVDSFRKGSASYCASGSTACPPTTAISFRAGWALTGVQDTNLRYDSAGDMYVGRTASGLPVDKVEFASLPPHFIGRPACVDSAIELCFPSLPQNMRRISEFCLASVVYHSEFLRSTLPPDHRILRNILFRHPDVLDALKSHVVCQSDQIRATGIPPHIGMMEKLSELISAQRDLESVLENRAIDTQILTRDFVEGLIRSSMESIGFPQVVQATRDGDTPMERGAEREPTSAESATVSAQLYLWDGKQHRVPQTFKFQDCTVPEAWYLWNRGNPGQNIMAYKYFEPKDMPDKNARKRLRDFKWLMGKIETQATELEISLVDMSDEDLTAVYQRCSAAVDVSSLSSKNRKRRKAQLSWRKVVNILRKEQRGEG